jgi:hypothetical protein
VASATESDQREGTDAMSFSIRKVEEPVYDGSTGAQVDTHVRYEIGGEIDGTFVPFANVRESYVTHLQDLDKRAQEKAQAEKPAETTASTTEQTA